ncbi:MAG: hypothetical protein V4576_04255, partial [Patescibacteria group bacterium]
LCKAICKRNIGKMCGSLFCGSTNSQRIRWEISVHEYVNLYLQFPNEHKVLVIAMHIMVRFNNDNSQFVFLSAHVESVNSYLVHKIEARHVTLLWRILCQLQSVSYEDHKQKKTIHKIILDSLPHDDAERILEEWKRNHRRR